MIRRTFLTLVAGLLTHLTRTGEDDQVRQPPAQPELAPEPHDKVPPPPKENRLLEVNGVRLVATNPVLTNTHLHVERLVGRLDEVEAAVTALADVTKARTNAVRFRVTEPTPDAPVLHWYAVANPVLTAVALAYQMSGATKDSQFVVMEGVQILHTGASHEVG